jgi:glutamine amidotransferase
MGWNGVQQNMPNPLTADFDDSFRFYFVHSYYVLADDEKSSVLKTSYGITFDSAIQKDNIFGVQFHPEKSHRFGMQLFKNFARI